MKTREANAKILAGGVPFTAANRCWPPGVPGIMGFTAEPVMFLQNPKDVTIIYQRGQVVRRIYLNEQHPANLKPSWMGHSIGRYEGDTLVVDTIGLNDKTYMDNFPIPHSEQIHVIERYRIVPGGRELITDAARPGDELLEDEVFEESICQENSDDKLSQDLVPVPTDDSGDF